MDCEAYGEIAIFAVLMAIWCVIQEYLFRRGFPKSLALMLPGLGCGCLIVVSWWRHQQVPPAESWWWFTLTILAASITAEFLIRATSAHGATLGANATGAAPLFAVICAPFVIGETPGRLAIFGIAVIALGGATSCIGNLAGW